MIAINDYRQFIAELVAAASQKCGIGYSKIRLAVARQQLIKLLKDQEGIVIAGNIPGSDINNNGYYWSEGECLLMVLEKMPEDYEGTEREYIRYGELQLLMIHIIRLLIGEDLQEFCDKAELDRSQKITVEWEFNTYGGFNGMSALFHLKDKNGTGL